MLNEIRQRDLTTPAKRIAWQPLCATRLSRCVIVVAVVGSSILKAGLYSELRESLASQLSRKRQISDVSDLNFTSPV